MAAGVAEAPGATLVNFGMSGFSRSSLVSFCSDSETSSAVAWPTRLYPRVIRGGGWDEDAGRLRSAARRKSDDDDWRGEDPNFPQSPWWFTSEPALSVGMRLVRPLHEPPAGERSKFWEADLPQIQADVDQRIESEGRGARGPVSPDLPAAIKRLTP